MKKYYAVLQLCHQKEIKNPYPAFLGDSTPIKIDMTWADSMIGVIPVFSNKKKAHQYAGKKYEILTFEKVK